MSDKKKKQEIEKIYNDYLIEINKLRKEQNDLIDAYIQKVTAKKLEELRKDIKNIKK
jgi:hypothetical protein